MTFIIYQIYLNQYLKPTKFHNGWKLELITFAPAEKGNFHAETSRSWTYRLETVDQRGPLRARPTISAHLLWTSCWIFLSSSSYLISLDLIMGHDLGATVLSHCSSFFRHFLSLQGYLQTLLLLCSQDALELFHKLKNFLKYCLRYFDINDNKLSPNKLLPRQLYEVSHDHFLHAAHSHPGAVSREEFPVSSSGSCTMLLYHFLLIVHTC